MISNYTSATSAYLWIWLPNAYCPIVAGKLIKNEDVFAFAYSKQYLDNPAAIALSPDELPLETGVFVPFGMHKIHSSLRDAAPDAWGRRIIEHEYASTILDELDYMLLSGTNGIGALNLQSGKDVYISRESKDTALSDLLLAVEKIEQRQPLPKALEIALLHGTSVGGARPKALITANNKQYIAKFSSSADHYNVIKAEFVAMKLAKLAGINVANVELFNVNSKQVLLVERFDRQYNIDGANRTQISRKYLLSGLTLLGLHEMEARYASYRLLADKIRRNFTNPEQDLLELFKRLVFNILVGNTDDHARNHAAFWDGKNLHLTPAYDLCPQWRSGFEATQAMAIDGKEGNLSKISNVLSIVDSFQLSVVDANVIIKNMLDVIVHQWDLVANQAGLTEIDKQFFWQKNILNPFCFYNSEFAV
jgi:serine/threonine-protein kinase HipA